MGDCEVEGCVAEDVPSGENRGGGEGKESFDTVDVALLDGKVEGLATVR